MIGPSFLPKELNRYIEKAKDSDKVLILKLIKHPNDFLDFFEVAAADPFWVNSYPFFIKRALTWLTRESIDDKLLEPFAKRAAAAIRKNFASLESYLPVNMYIRLKDFKIAVNTLLYSTISEPLKEGFFRCRENGLNVLVLDQWTYHEFSSVIDYARHGEIADLWKRGEEELFAILDMATSMSLDEVSVLAQQMMQKYVTKTSAIALLIKSHQKGWLVLKSRSMELINDQDLGVTLTAPFPERLAVRFAHFEQIALDTFCTLASVVTDIACSKEWIDVPAFTKVMLQCPYLYTLDLSHHTTFCPCFIDIPKELQVLNLSYCDWVQGEDLRKFSKICPELKSLHLSYNQQLISHDFAELEAFKELSKLHLDGCSQLRDEDLKIILKAVNLTSLNIAHCHRIGNPGFFDLAQSAPLLEHLDVSYTNLSDACLVAIGASCHHLSAINITKCQSLTEKGINAFHKVQKHILIKEET